MDVGFNSIGKEMALELINIFKEKKMVSVGLAKCSLGPEEAPAVADMIRVIPSLTSINLSQNWGGPEFAKTLAPAIAASASMTSCDVRHNDISGDGAKELSAVVLSNTKIEKFNEIPIKEMRADSFTELKLDGKNIGVVGGMAVAGLVPVMASITQVLPN